MAGGEEFSMQPCTKADEIAPKRKAATAGLDGCAPERTGEEVNEDEPWRAVDSQLTLLEGEEGADRGFDEFIVGLRASFAANVRKIFANNPSMTFSSPAPAVRADGQNDATKEDEELCGGGAVVASPVSSV
jgi:hypothetical protein